MKCVPADDEFVVVLGDSHVRSFAYSLDFLPLFIGPGKTVSFVSRRRARNTMRVVRNNLRLLESGRPLLVVLGEPDVRHIAATKREADQFSVVEDCVSRYSHLLKFCRANWKGSIFVYNVVPSRSNRRNVIARYYNECLARKCTEIGLKFVSIWTSIMLPSGEVSDEYVADEIHLNDKVAPYVLRELGIGRVEAASPRDALRPNNFAWSYLYRFPVAGGSETRIWGDAPCTLASAKFEKTKQLDRALMLIRRSLVRVYGFRNLSIVIVGGREGYAAFQLGLDGFKGVVSVESDPSKIRAGRRLASLCVKARPKMVCSKVAGWEKYTVDADVVVGLLDDDNDDQIATFGRVAGNARLHIFVLAFAPSLLERLSGTFGFEFESVSDHGCEAPFTAIAHRGMRTETLLKSFIGRLGGAIRLPWWSWKNRVEAAVTPNRRRIIR